MEFVLNHKTVGNDFSIINSICSNLQIDSSANFCLFELEKKEDHHLLKITATNFDFVYHQELEVKGSGAGAVCIPPLKLANFISALPTHDVLLKAYSNVSSELNTVKATAQGYEINLLGAEKQNFPAVVLEEIPKKITITVKELKEILSFVGSSIHEAKLRKNLTGMNLNWNEGSWYFVGSDSHRISLVKKQDSFSKARKGEEKNSIILSKKAMNEISKIISPFDQNERVDLHFDQRVFLMKTKTSYFRTILVAEDYPDVTIFYNYKNPNLLKVNRAEIWEALKVFRSGLEKDQSSIQVEIYPQKLSILYTTNQTSMKKEINCSFQGEPLKMSFNMNYLMDAFESFPLEEEMEIHIKDDQSPVMFFDPKIPEFSHILMPLRA